MAKRITEKKEECAKEVVIQETTQIRKRRRGTVEDYTSLVKIPRDTQVLLMNNVSRGEVFYRCPVTHTSFTLSRYGETRWIEYETFKNMRNDSESGSGILEKYWLIPIDMECPDKNITLVDMLKSVDLYNLYKDENLLCEDNIDYLLQDASVREFDDSIQTVSDDYLESILDRAIALHEKGETIGRDKRFALDDILKVKTGERNKFTEIVRKYDERR